MSVGARFRPAVPTAGGEEEAEADEQGVSLTMPFHQRVAMVRAARGCSQAVAMRLVMKERAGTKASKRAAAAAGGGKGGNGADGAADGFGCVVASRPPDAGALAAQRARQESAAAALTLTLAPDPNPNPEPDPNPDPEPEPSP